MNKPELGLLVVLPVDDDGGDLLVHEDEDGGQQGEHRGQKTQAIEYILSL